MKLGNCSYENLEYIRLEDSVNRVESVEGKLVISWEIHSYLSIPLLAVGEYISDGDLSKKGDLVIISSSTLDIIKNNEPEKDLDIKEFKCAPLPVRVNTTNLTYSLHKMSKESWIKVKDEHDRFVKEMGFVKEYGKKWNPARLPSQAGSFVIKFKPLIVYKDILVTPVGKINYDQIVNHFPNIVLDEREDLSY